jgi:peptidoglycan hydrolase-like protein with peptidoglycan-binding domain
MFDAIQENPAIAAGICTFAVAFSLVAGNALYGQRGGHPVPLFATRDAITTRSVEKPGSGETRNQVKQPVKQRKDVQIPVPQARPDPAATDADSNTLVRETQQGLLALGIYNGEVDGLYGPKTRDAIMRFERAAGLEQTGLVTASLAERLARGAKAPGSAKVADGGKPAAAPKTIEKVIADTSDIPAEQPEAGARQANSEAPSESGAAAENGTSAESAGDDVRIAALVARIQIGLQNFGELEVPLDGQLGASTIEAIRRFQERYGINADGQPSEMLVDKLEQIGALRKS